MWFSSRTPYRKAQSGDAAMDEDKRELLDEHELPNDEHHCVCGRRAKLSANQWLVHIALTCLSASVGFIFVALTHSSNYDSAMSDKECAKQVSSFSPVFEAVEYYDVDYLNAFTQTSIYRGPPSPELDKAWMDLWLFEGIRIPTYGLSLLNRSDADAGEYIKVSPEYGDGYMAIVETFHQIHCLDTIRQYTWWLLGKYTQEQLSPSLEYSEKGKRMHVDHCIETLRITLMCQADLSPVLIRRDPSTPQGQRADFNSHHRCRNFTKIQEWAREHAVRGYHVGEHNHQHDND